MHSSLLFSQTLITTRLSFRLNRPKSSVAHDNFIKTKSRQMKKVIIHVGLAKTATTTLQHDLFQRLHEEGKINFLGKTLNYDLKTGKAVWINETGQLIREACEGNISIPNAEIINELLSEDKINIFSDEGLSIFYPNRGSLSLEAKMNNLKRILRGHDTRIVLTIRNQLDCMYSLYVQLYPDFFHKIPELNCFQKYAEFYLKNKTHPMFESFDYESYLNLIKSHFDTKVLIYEDLKTNPESFYQQLQEAFVIDIKLIRSYLKDKHRNKKVTSKNGDPKLRSYESFATKFSHLFRKNSILFTVMKNVYNSPSLKLKPLLTKKRQFIGTHQKPNEKLKRQLESKLLMSSNFKFEDYGLDKEVLLSYGYVNTSN